MNLNVRKITIEVCNVSEPKWKHFLSKYRKDGHVSTITVITLPSFQLDLTPLTKQHKNNVQYLLLPYRKIGGKWAKICRHYYHPRNPKATVIEVFYVKYVTKNPARGGYPPFVSPIYQARFPEIHYSPLQDETFRYEFPKWWKMGQNL